MADAYTAAYAAAREKGRKHLHWKTLARLKRMEDEEEARQKAMGLDPGAPSWRQRLVHVGCLSRDRHHWLRSIG